MGIQATIHKHTDLVCQGKRQQLSKLRYFCQILSQHFTFFQDIFCRMVACTTLPASINCVYSFNEFMCLWCGLKVKLIPDAERETEGCSALLLAEREIHKILWKNIVNNLLSKLLRSENNLAGEAVTLLRWRNVMAACGHLMRGSGNIFILWILDWFPN